MATSVDTSLPRPSAAEIERRIAEFCRMSWERRLPAVVVYHGDQVACPWATCGFRIAAIHFQFEQWLAPRLLDAHLESWWQGSGLIATCPNCQRSVLFTVRGKRTVSDVDVPGAQRLPADWHTKAHVVSPKA